MEFKVKDFQVDLGVTPVENIFLNNYLAIAPASAIKVYLYAYKKAYDGKEDNESFAEIGKKLDLSEIEVGDAFGYWQDQGVVDITAKGDDFVCSFISLRELFLGLTGDEDIEEEGPSQGEKEKLEGNSQEGQLTNTQMFDKIEEVIGTMLLPNELERILKHREEFGQDRDLIVHGFVYSSKAQGKRNVNYVLTVLRNWAIDGIHTMAQLKAKNDKNNRGQEKKKKKTSSRKVQREDKKSADDIEAMIRRQMLADVKKAKGEKTD